ncbi:MAG TPA: hypothetical protein VFH27_07860 [Longimicrobiaceae bacterium]|nr:hypothetical protein [Longimicrobiaceae bacterium]
MTTGGAIRHSDTSPDVEKMRIEALRRMTGEQRIAITFQLTNMMRRAAVGRIRAEHPDYEEWQVKLEYLREVFHPDPLPRGFEEWVRGTPDLPRRG